ncbi:MAG: hypothetical protein HQL37_09680 [Alphaproteobacteria bacterium]|nr:hypothetical protein [Alphaproteobacteria bacterium]
MTSKIVTLSPVRLPITETSLCAWLGQAAPGDTLTYHRGALAHDRTSYASRIPEAERIELVRTSRRALWAFGRGLVHLVQRRHGEDDYSYILVARPRSRKVAASLPALLTAEAA